MRSAALLAALPLVAAAPAKRAPLLIDETAELIEGSYIIKLKTGEGFEASAVSALVSKADAVYEKLSSFSASLSEEEVEVLRSDPNVSDAGTSWNKADD